MMPDILCPTCGRPNPEDLNLCDFCGSPIKELDASSPGFDSLRDDFLSPDKEDGPGPIDESSRLDSFFTEPEPIDASPLDTGKDPADPTKDPFRLDEILPPEDQMPETEPLDQSSSYTKADESGQFEDFLSEQAPPKEVFPEPVSSPGEEEEDGFLLDDLFASEEIEEPIRPEEINISEDTQPEPRDDSPPSEESWFEEPSQESIIPEEKEGPVGDPFSLDQFSDDKDQSLDMSTADQEGKADINEPSPEIEPGDLWEEPLYSTETPDFGDDSGWLDMLVDPESSDESSQEIISSVDDDKPQTDWLDRIKRLNKSADLVEEDSSFPDWLSATEKPAAELPEEPAVEEPEDPASSDLPSWLQIDEDDESLSEFLRKKDLTDDEYIPKFVTDNLPQDTPLPDSYGAPEPDEDSSLPKKFPSWAESESKPEEVPDDLQFLTGTEEGKVPDRVVDPFQGEDDYLDDLFDDELPEWLTSASADEEILPFEEEISVGELPGWVEAMRPVVESSDTSGLSDDEDYIENYGPLAGIPSVLPAEADIVMDPEKESVKPLDLVATKTHQENVNLIKRLIGDESKTKPIQKAAPVQTQRVLRWLIAIILLVTTAGMIIFGGTYVNPDPEETYSPNTGYGSLYNKIDDLSDGQPVLIAFDYQPASVGELHTAAAGVVDHLMEQGTYLTLLSTEPTGPALAEYFLKNTQADHHYIHTQQYINLGYLPGESAGLLSFIFEPKEIIPLAFDGSNAWGSPPLIDVDNIQDFDMLLVITDDPNTAKNWIEQVGTILADTPLTMVVSAQVEPLIQPYFRASPQLLNGYVSGVIDSMNYEGLLGRPNLAHVRWMPFNVGIIISVGTIFIGGLANGILSLFSRHRARKIGDTKK